MKMTKFAVAKQIVVLIAADAEWGVKLHKSQ
jgi:hypothetical protein